MGIIGVIANIKAKALKGQGKIVKIKTDYHKQVSLAEVDLTTQKQELREAQQIRADLKADRMKKVEGEQPSKLKRLGKGLASHMNKKKEKTPMIGVPTSNTNQPVSTQQGGIFGGQRNLDVGGETESPFVHKRKKDLF